MESLHVTLPADVAVALQHHLLRGPDEHVALVFGHPVRADQSAGVIASRWIPVPPEALLVQRPDQFAVDSTFIVRHVKEARKRHECVLLAHSHPGDNHPPRFSHADDRGEAALYPFLAARLTDRMHGAVLFAPGGLAARLRMEDSQVMPAAVRVIGRHRYNYPTGQRRVPVPTDPQHSRQELIWGSHGQGLLRDVTIGIIGAGGTGSVVIQQLIHLGVGRLIIVDRKTFTRDNLARVVGACIDDVAQTPKAEIAARTARLVDPAIEVVPLTRDVTDNDILGRLVDADLLFLCTDGHYSRAVINTLGVQYGIPVVDLGFRIEMNQTKDRVASAVGEVRMVVPGGYCLSCAGVLDAERIRAEQASPEEREAFPHYFVDLNVADPSVITVNSVIASLATSIGVDMLIPTMKSTTALDSYRYNALKGLVTHVARTKDVACGICGIDGIGGLADDHPLPGRWPRRNGGSAGAGV